MLRNSSKKGLIPTEEEDYEDGSDFLDESEDPDKELATDMPENPKENDYNDMENPSDSAFEDATSIEDYPVEEKSMSSTLEEIRASEYEGQEQPQDSAPVEHIEPFDDVNREILKRMIKHSLTKNLE